MENGDGEQLSTFVCNDYASWHQAWILTLQSNSKLTWVLHASREKLVDEAFEGIAISSLVTLIASPSKPRFKNMYKMNHDWHIEHGEV